MGYFIFDRHSDTQSLFLQRNRPYSLIYNGFIKAFAARVRLWLGGPLRRGFRRQGYFFALVHVAQEHGSIFAPKRAPFFFYLVSLAWSLAFRVEFKGDG